jgi:hypothetical protein
MRITNTCNFFCPKCRIYLVMTFSAIGIALGFGISASTGSAYGDVRRLNPLTAVQEPLVEAGDKCLNVK